jgi:hypothetical protein
MPDPGLSPGQSLIRHPVLSAKNLFSNGARLGEAALSVKEILSQPVVSGWDLIPVARIRLRTSADADYCLKEWISVRIAECFVTGRST